MPPETVTTSSSDDPFESISNFFDSGLWSAISLLLQVFVVLLWAALAYWTYQDARRRIEAPGVVAACVALSVFIPFLGTIIYLIVRPPEYLDEARERELELVALERRLSALGDDDGQVAEGLRRGGAGSDHALQRALRDAGLVSREQVQDLDKRLTELEFRLRLLDRATVPGQPASPASERADVRAERRDRERESTVETGDTGRASRWRRPRRPVDGDDFE